MAAAKYLHLKDGDRVLSSGGLGSMGFSLPASIGSWYADNNVQIVSFMGDGGLQMNIQELEVIRRERIPCKIFVLNDKTISGSCFPASVYSNSRRIFHAESF